MAVTAYKRNQGRPTRQIALCVTTAALSWLLLSVVALFTRRQAGIEWLGICLVVIAAAAALSLALLNRPRWADFLISVQAEIDKVTWPTTQEVRRATVVVLALIATMAVIIFCYDVIWRWVFEKIGFLQIYRS